MTRADLLSRIGAAVAECHRGRYARVAVDGVDGAGKTMFADELARVVRDLGRPVVRAGVDGFHRRRADRHRRGRSSPEGFYYDTYDHQALFACLLDPLAPNGSGRYRESVFDHTTDELTPEHWAQAPPGAVLIFDGLFLHRPELVDHWDYSIFLRVPFEVSVPRMAGRDGTDADPTAISNQRYVDGQRLYLNTAEPERHATAVVDNTDLARPSLLG